MRRIGIVGVGLLGTAVATRLLEARFEVVGYDVRPQQVKALATRGLQLAGDLGEAVAGADLVFTILPSLDAVDAVVRGPGGLLEKLPATATIAQMSTISPPLTRALGAAATKRGVGFLDTPMSGTSAMVARGDCTIFVGGDRARADACRPVFDAIARKTLYVGETGLATLAKLATNLLVGLNTAAVAEALVLGAKGGLEPAVLLDILKQSAAGSRMLDVRGPLMVKHEFEAQMKTELFLKDFKLMLEEGMRVGAPLPLTSLTQQLTMATVAAGRGDEDIAAIITTLERLAGMER
jgi:3-hydroxyisobutyrate dehydrogenase-like beta-hydroxyacid dehydrogenase